MRMKFAGPSYKEPLLWYRLPIVIHHTPVFSHPNQQLVLNDQQLAASSFIVQTGPWFIQCGPEVCFCGSRNHLCHILHENGAWGKDWCCSLRKFFNRFAWGVAYKSSAFPYLFTSARIQKERRWCCSLTDRLCQLIALAHPQAGNSTLSPTTLRERPPNFLPLTVFVSEIVRHLSCPFQCICFLKVSASQ